MIAGDIPNEDGVNHQPYRFLTDHCIVEIEYNYRSLDLGEGTSQCADNISLAFFDAFFHQTLQAYHASFDSRVQLDHRERLG